MKRMIKPFALAATLMAVAGSAIAGATVTFVDPDHYTDVPSYGPDRELMMDDLRQHVERLAKDLPPETHLRVEFLDIDLAGRMKPWWGRAADVRLMTGKADFPHLRFRYTLERNGQVIRAGEEALTNMRYLDRSNPYTSNERLRHEKAMLDEWFKQVIQAG